ncbi:DUF1707 domain-containing protein [Corallincola platygyrae]|uniref:DUF1707 domain-containing protein n=1 Tax=Corallincola platygyrae TaxID=1193278 RepID=A0ABW4XGP8_9GAMM
MAVKLEDRPIDTLRQEVIDQLIMNYGHGELSLEAFERRLDIAMQTTSHEKLVEQVADLQLAVNKEYVDEKQQQMGVKLSPLETKANDYMISLFGGNDVSGPRPIARTTWVVDIFSGADIDLTDAVFPQGEVRFRMFNLFSGTDFYVPENVNVITRMFSIFGGVDCRITSTPEPNAPTIIVEGIAIFSGIDIKVKKSLKERFIGFAEQFKKLLRSE